MFGIVKLTLNVNLDKYSYPRYSIEFDYHSLFSATSFDLGANVTFGVENSSSVHIDNQKKGILLLGKCPTQRLINDTTISREPKYSTNFSRLQRSFCNSFLFVNATDMYQFKAKGSETKPYPLCLGNISNDFTGNNMKKIQLNGYKYDFSADYNIDNSNIVDIHNYLMKKHNMK